MSNGAARCVVCIVLLHVYYTQILWVESAALRLAINRSAVDITIYDARLCVFIGYWLPNAHSRTAVFIGIFPHPLAAGGWWVLLAVARLLTGGGGVGDSIPVGVYVCGFLCRRRLFLSICFYSRCSSVGDGL